MTWPEFCNDIANCQVRFGDTTVMVSQAWRPYPQSQAAMYMCVVDTDAAMQRALDAGAPSELAVADIPCGDRPYGDGRGGIRDPAGSIWWVSQRLTDQPYHSG